MPLAKPMRGLQALRYEGLATLKPEKPKCCFPLILETLLPSIIVFPKPTCGRGIKARGASPENEERAIQG